VPSSEAVATYRGCYSAFKSLPSLLASPPPSPSTLLNTQIIISKAAQEKASKAKKATKSSKSHWHVDKVNKGKVAAASAMRKAKRTYGYQFRE
jgi:hypothetical protein